MKKVALVLVVALLGISILTSCRAKKENCGAYGYSMPKKKTVNS